MKDRAPEDIRRAEEEAEHRQLEAESLVEAERDRWDAYDEGRRLRDLDEQATIDAWKMAYDGDPYWRWGDYELDIMQEHVTPVEADFDLFEEFCAEGDESLGRDTHAEESGIGEDIPEHLDWGHMGL